MACSEIERHTETDKFGRVNKCTASSTSAAPTTVSVMHQFDDNKAITYDRVIGELISATLVMI